MTEPFTQNTVYSFYIFLTGHKWHFLKVWQGVAETHGGFGDSKQIPSSITLCDFLPTRVKDSPCERNAAIPLVLALKTVVGHCETGSGMAAVTVLPPKVASNKILTASDIRDDQLSAWLLLPPMSPDQVRELMLIFGLMSTWRWGSFGTTGKVLNQL